MLETDKETHAPISNFVKSYVGNLHSWPQGKAGTVRESQADSSGNERHAPRRGGSELLIERACSLLGQPRRFPRHKF